MSLDGGQELSPGAEHQDAGTRATEALLARTERPYTVNDVASTLDAIVRYNDFREDHGMVSSVDKNSMYYFLTTGEMGSAMEPEVGQSEEEPDKAAYDALVLDVYSRGRENLIANQERAKGARGVEAALGGDGFAGIPAVTTADEVRALDPNLVPIMAASYQADNTIMRDPGGGSNPYLLVRGKVLSGYEYGDITEGIKIYLNPPVNAIPEIAAKFVDAATAQNVPFTFKLIDYSLPSAQAAKWSGRQDRMVFYPDMAHGAQMVSILESIRAEHPDWFADRPLPMLAAEVSEGIGISEEKSAHQSARFPNDSAQGIRAELLFNSWKDATRELLLDYPDIEVEFPGEIKTFRQIFDKVVTDYVERNNARMPSMAKDPAAVTAKLWAAQLDGKALESMYEPPHIYRPEVDTILQLTIAALTPTITADTFLPWVEAQIASKAGEYDINPNNLAVNGQRAA